QEPELVLKLSQQEAAHTADPTGQEAMMQAVVGVRDKAEKAETKPTIQGEIWGPDNRPVPSAILEIRDEADTIVQTLRIENGEYNTTLPRAGRYTFIVRSPNNSEEWDRFVHEVTLEEGVKI